MYFYCNYFHDKVLSVSSESSSTCLRGTLVVGGGASVDFSSCSRASALHTPVDVCEMPKCSSHTALSQDRMFACDGDDDAHV